MNDGHLIRVRWGVRGALVLGVATSVAANILHANPNPISQAISAWPPLALLLTVELISRVPVHRPSLAAVRMTTTAGIAGIAAWVSYTHMAGVAARYGEQGLAPYLIPLSVDGVVVVASVCLVELAGRMRTTAETAPSTVDTADATGTASDVTADSTPDAVPDTTTDTGRTSNRKRDTASAVAKLRKRHPDMSTADIARRVGVTDRTVRRHLNTVTA